MSRFKYMPILVALLSFLSCNTENNKLEKIINKVIPAGENTNLHYVVVIPVKGCSSCGATAIDFCKKNYNKHSGIKYIITNYVSEKELKIILGRDVYSNNNVFYDKENKFGKAGFNTMYPIIIKWNNKNVKSFEYAKPGKDGAIYSSILINIEI